MAGNSNQASLVPQCRQLFSHQNCRLLGQSWKKTSTRSFAVLTASGQSHESKVDWPAVLLLFLAQNAETALLRTLFDAHQRIYMLLYSLKRCWKNIPISLHCDAPLNCLLGAVSWKFVYCFASITHLLAEVRIRGLLFGVWKKSVFLVRLTACCHCQSQWGKKKMFEVVLSCAVYGYLRCMLHACCTNVQSNA